VGSCEHGNESSIPIKTRDFLCLSELLLASVERFCCIQLVVLDYFHLALNRVLGRRLS
jgi:hypothetical protein